MIPFVPYLPFKRLRDAYFGLQRVLTYSQAGIREHLSLSPAEKEGTLMPGFLDKKTGQPKAPYSAWTIALAGHGFM
jgi:hypothetical protein